MKKIALLLLLAFGFSGCEKDDICDAATSTTPQLVISFYLNGLPQNVTDLKVVGKGKKEGVVFNSDLTDKRFLTNANSIKLPLDTNADFTEYSFTLNYGNAQPALVNTDVLRFNYIRNTVFVSRACGFKTTFQLNAATPYQQTDNRPSDKLWMTYIQVVKNNIENENEIHIKISL
jgi:Family of unknown function (DUF6452)